MNNITIYDIAKQFNVNASTVNRALNDKPGVSEETRREIKAYAKRTGYTPNKAAKSLSRKPIKIGFVISDVIPEFSHEVLRGVQAAYEEMSDFNIEFDYHVCNGNKEFLDKLRKLGENGNNGILTIPCRDTRGFHQVFSELNEKKITVANIVNDIEGMKRLFSVRLDGKLTGRIAAELLWWFTGGGRVAIFTAYKEIGIHADIIEGFLEEAKGKPLEIVRIYENHDDPELACYSTEKLLDKFPNIKGIFISSANSSTVCKKIKEKELGGKIRIVAMDIFPELKGYIEEDVVHASLFQDPFKQGNMAFKKLYGYLDGVDIANEEILFKPQIILKSNLSQFV